VILRGWVPSIYGNQKRRRDAGATKDGAATNGGTVAKYLWRAQHAAPLRVLGSEDCAVGGCPAMKEIKRGGEGALPSSG
jgi:hypothetical protein